ncbi:hypothetical protein HDU93_003582 [Gonapodya sp. JEL0774]|nr:hypothetical protein HDU93_003582 [Gonapodya sp. JEL0774]
MPRSRSVNVIPAASVTKNPIRTHAVAIRESDDSFGRFSDRNLGHGRRSSDSHLHLQRVLVASAQMSTGDSNDSLAKVASTNQVLNVSVGVSRPPSGVGTFSAASEAASEARDKTSPKHPLAGGPPSKTLKRKLTTPFEKFKLRANGLGRPSQVAVPSMESLPAKYQRLGVAVIVTDPVTVFTDGRVVDDPGIWTVFSRAVTVYRVVVMVRVLDVCGK